MVHRQLGHRQVLHQAILAQVVVLGEEGIPFGYELADAHPGRVRVAQRLGHVPPQGDRIGELGSHGLDREHIAIAQGQLLGALEVHDLHGARCLGLGGLDALQQGLLEVRHGTATACQSQHLGCGPAGRFEFEDGRGVHRAQHRHTRACNLVDDDVSVLQPLILAALAAHDEVVQVEFGQGLAGPSQLHAAHAAIGRGPSAGKDSVDQGGEAGKRVTAGMLGLPDDKDLDAAQLAERHAQLEALEHPFDLLAQTRFDLAGSNAGHPHGAHPRDADLAIAIHHHPEIDFDRAPPTQVQFVARTEGIVRRHRKALHRGEVVGDAAGGEIRAAEQRQRLTRGGVHEPLELVGLTRRVGRHRFKGAGLFLVRRVGAFWPRRHGRDNRGHARCGWGRAARTRRRACLGKRRSAQAHSRKGRGEDFCCEVHSLSCSFF